MSTYDERIAADRAASKARNARARREGCVELALTINGAASMMLDSPLQGWAAILEMRRLLEQAIAALDDIEVHMDTPAPEATTDDSPTVEQMLDELVSSTAFPMMTLAHWNLSGPQTWRVDLDCSGDGPLDVTAYGETPLAALTAVYRAVEEGRE